MQLLKLFQPKRPYVSLQKRTISDNFGSKDFNLLIYIFFFMKTFVLYHLKTLNLREISVSCQFPLTVKEGREILASIRVNAAGII